MSVANVIFDVLAPVAILVGLGAALGPRLHIDVGGLSRLAYNVFGPAFIFAVLAGADLERGVVARLVLAGLAGMASAVALAVLWSRITGAGYELTAATAITSSYGNVGNAGLAIVAFSLGEQALPVAGVLMLTINLTGLVLSVGLAEARSRSWDSRRLTYTRMSTTSLTTTTSRRPRRIPGCLGARRRERQLRYRSGWPPGGPRTRCSSREAYHPRGSPRWCRRPPCRIRTRSS